MKTLSEGFGLEKKEEVLASASDSEYPGDVRILGEASKKDLDEGNPKTKKDKDKIERVKKEDLELVFARDAVFFNGINKIVQTIMGAGYSIECSNQKIKKWYIQFLDNIGNTGGELTWDELLSQIFRHQCVYGDSWVENIFNKKQNKIVDLDLIDSKKMDYLKNQSGQPVFTDKGRILGYTYKIPQEMVGKINGDAWPAGPYEKNERIFLEPKRIAHFKLFMVGDGLYPMGMIEPAYNPAFWKMNIEKGLANFIYASGFPIRVIKVGDRDHPPTPQKIQNGLDNVKKMAYNQNIAIPYYDNIELLESKNSERMGEHLNYFQDQEVTSMGTPKPFVTGGGEATNRSTLVIQDRIFRLTLKDIINRTCSTIVRQIFSRIAEYEGFNVVPTIKWGDIEETAEIERIQILLDAVKSGVIKPEKVTPEIEKLIKYNKQ